MRVVRRSAGCGGAKIMVLSGVLSACLSPSRRLADGKKYPDQYSVEMETKVHEISQSRSRFLPTSEHVINQQ